MRVLIGCEFSGIVRDAFRRAGHDAWSCDLEASERPGPHLQVDLLRVLDLDWDMLIAFPPCTYLCRSGARWWRQRQAEQKEAVEFVLDILAAPIPSIAVENPIGHLSTAIRKPDQIIQPWMFGHGEVKATCLWLDNLPKLVPTQIVEGRSPIVHYTAPGPNRSKNRSRTLSGIALAMSQQWSNL